MIHTSKPSNPRRGDFFVFPVNDRAGRENRAGGHANFGYSGFCLVLVWDGSHWANLTRKCQERVGIEVSNFDYAYERPAIVDVVVEALNGFMRQHSNVTVRSWWWKGRKYAELSIPEVEVGPAHSS